MSFSVMIPVMDGAEMKARRKGGRAFGALSTAGNKIRVPASSVLSVPAVLAN